MQEFTKQGIVKDIKDNINKVIIGKSEVEDLLLTALLAHGHILLEDVPGTGKTMLAKSLAKSIDCEFSRIQFTPDLLPSDITGINYYNQQTAEFTFRRGPIFSNIVLADEINRATPRTQSALLECMEEKQVTVDNMTYKLYEPYMVIATENPIETAGTYQLPEAQLDRFLLQTSMGYPDKVDEIDIINSRMNAEPIGDLSSVCKAQDIVDASLEANAVYVHDAIKTYVVDIVNASRQNENIAIGISPRGTLSMIRAAKAYAYVMGRNYVIPEDITKLAIPVFAHRLILKRGLLAASRKEELLNEIIKNQNVPTENWESK